MSDSEGWQPDPSGPEDRSDQPAAAEPPPPSAAPPPPAAPPSSAPVPAPASWPQPVSGYPIVVDIETPDRIARWRPVVQWILAIPLVIVLYVLRIVAQVCALIGWFAALITGELPESLGDFIAGYYRYALRTYSYVWFLRGKTYPPFAPPLGYPDPGDDPARFDVQRERRLSRLKVLFRLILVIPQAFVLFFLGIAAYVAVVIAFFAVIITGRWPAGLRNFVAGFIRWALRVDAWFLLLADPYPPFSLT